MKQIKDLQDHHTDVTVNFVVTTVEPLPASDQDLEEAFKLVSKTSITNMTLFDADGRIRYLIIPSPSHHVYSVAENMHHLKRS